MPSSKDYPRHYRVADQIQRELAEIIRDELKDPRVSPLLTLSEIEVSRDMSLATVYFTVMDADAVESTGVALERAAGFLRSALAGRLRLRITPKLRFRYDRSLEEGARMDALIDAAIQADRRNNGE